MISTSVNPALFLLLIFISYLSLSAAWTNVKGMFYEYCVAHELPFTNRTAPLAAGVPAGIKLCTYGAVGGRYAKMGPSGASFGASMS
jgi:hypothetical protein